jgi:hypothetical protein
MADPQSPTVGFYDQTTGSNSGTWGVVLNANFLASDSLVGNVFTISLTGLGGSSVTLTTPPNSGSSWAGPYASQSAVIKLTGSLSGNCTVFLPRPGFWIFDNQCTTSGSAFIAIQSISAGKYINAPPGEIFHAYCDGTDVKYVNLDHVGSYMQLATSTVPSWIANQSVPPYLNCDGSAFSGVTYPALAALLGGTTLPDSRGRFMATLNQGTGRLTSGVGGLDGNTLLAGSVTQSQTLTAGQMPQQTTGAESATHTHVPGTTDNYVHTNSSTSISLQTGPGLNVGFIGTTGTESATHTHTLGNVSPSAVPIVPPGLVGGLTLIRAA